jgi:hypothetical protein
MDRINRMDRIKEKTKRAEALLCPSAYPVNPVNPVHSSGIWF